MPEHYDATKKASELMESIQKIGIAEWKTILATELYEAYQAGIRFAIDGQKRKASEDTVKDQTASPDDELLDLGWEAFKPVLREIGSLSEQGSSLKLLAPGKREIVPVMEIGQKQLFIVKEDSNAENTE